MINFKDKKIFIPLTVLLVILTMSPLFYILSWIKYNPHISFFIKNINTTLIYLTLILLLYTIVLENKTLNIVSIISSSLALLLGIAYVRSLLDFLELSLPILILYLTISQFKSDETIPSIVKSYVSLDEMNQANIDFNKGLIDISQYNNIKKSYIDSRK